MEDDEIREIASRLTSASEAEIAQSQLTGEKLPWLWLIGNRAALLQYAAAFLRAAASPIRDGDNRGEPATLDHLQMTDSETDYILGAVQRTEQLPEAPEAIAERKQR